MKKSGVGSVGALLLGLGLLSGCTMQGPGNLKVHEVLFYGASQERLAWVYGTLSGGRGSLSIAGQTVELKAQLSDALATPDSLSVAGKATYNGKTSALSPISSVSQQGNTYAVSAAQNLAATYLVSGGSWFKLSGALSAGAQVQANAQPISGLGGAGNLTSEEAAVISRRLAAQPNLIVTVLPSGELPDAPLKIDPAPGETLQTGLYLQTLQASASATPTPGGTVSDSNGSGSVNVRELGSGNNAQAQSAQVTLATTQSALSALWSTAYGLQSSPPPVPNLSGQTAVGIFLGSKPTGGYGVSVASAQASGGVLTINVNVRQPGAGSITTQSLTSPWTIISVPGQYNSVSVRDQNGQPLGN